MLRVVAFLLAALSADVLLAGQPPLQSKKNWEVRGASDRITWVELHKIDPTDPSVIHVELLSRKKTDKPWEIEHLKAHIAITLEALQRSVVRPLREERGVYPETFDFGYKHWKEEAGAGKRVICSTTLYDCVDTGAK